MKLNKILIILVISNVIIGCNRIDPGDYRYPCLGEMEGDDLILESYQDYLKKHPSVDSVQYVHSMETHRGFKFLRQATPREIRDSTKLPENSLLYFYTSSRDLKKIDKQGNTHSKQHPILHIVAFSDVNGRMMPNGIETWRKKQW